MKMKWALNELNNYQDDPLQINGTVDLSQSLKKRDKEIISVDPIEINSSFRVFCRRECYRIRIGI